MSRNIRHLCEAAVIAAVYAALTLALAPLSFNSVQVRVAEALCVLPFFTPAAIPGLFAGCLISNIIGTPLGPMDIVIGSLSTLAAAIITRRIRQKWLAPLPAVAINMFTIAWVLSVTLGLPYWSSAVLVGIGQLVACYGIGMPLLLVLNKYRKVVFIQP